MWARPNCDLVRRRKLEQHQRNGMVKSSEFTLYTGCSTGEGWTSWESDKETEVDRVWLLAAAAVISWIGDGPMAITRLAVPLPRSLSPPCSEPPLGTLATGLASQSTIQMAL